MFNAFPFHDADRATQTEPVVGYGTGLGVQHTRMTSTTSAGGPGASMPVIHYALDPDRGQIIENCKFLFPATTPAIITRSYDTTLQALVINTSRAHFLPVDSAGVEASGVLLSYTTKKGTGVDVIRGLLQKSQTLLNTRVREHSSRSLAAEEEVSRILNSEAWSNYPENVKAKAGGLILRRLWDEMVEKEKAKEKREIEECLSLFEQERGKVREQQEKEKERDAEREKNQILDRQKRLEEELRRCQRDYVQRYGDRGRARDIGFVLGDEYPASSPGRETFHGPPTPTGHPSGFMFGSGPGDEIRSPISRSESPRLPPLSIAGELQLMRVTNGTSTASSISAGMQTPPSRGVTLRDS